MAKHRFAHVGGDAVRLWLPASLLMVLGCHKDKEPARVPQVPREAPKIAAPGNASLPPKKPPGPLEVELAVVRGEVGIGLSVVNRGESLSRLHQAVLLQREVQGKYEDVAAHALTLRRDCQHEGCVTLAPAGELLAPSHLELIEGERCDRELTPKAKGHYRLRVASCDGSQHASIDFSWPAP